jgi:hypothetical protein
MEENVEVAEELPAQEGAEETVQVMEAEIVE